MMKLVIYKIYGGVRLFNFEYSAMSDEHAKIVAQQAYKCLGLIGRYYVEMSNGECFSIG